MQLVVGGVILETCKHNVAYTSLVWIPYAQGCDLSSTYSNVVVDDRPQPWAYGDVFWPTYPRCWAQNTCKIQEFAPFLAKKGRGMLYCVLGGPG